MRCRRWRLFFLSFFGSSALVVIGSSCPEFDMFSVLIVVSLTLRLPVSKIITQSIKNGRRFYMTRFISRQYSLALLIAMQPLSDAKTPIKPTPTPQPTATRNATPTPTPTSAPCAEHFKRGPPTKLA